MWYPPLHLRGGGISIDGFFHSSDTIPIPIPVAFGNDGYDVDKDVDSPPDETEGVEGVVELDQVWRDGCVGIYSTKEYR